MSEISPTSQTCQARSVIQHPGMRHIAVLIPARNEADLLPGCLTSVLQARALLPPGVTCDIVVAVDCSTDRTLQIASTMLKGCGVALTTRAGVVGMARACAADLALSRYDGAHELCWLANTDADCCVPESWLLDHLHFAAQGAHVIAGIVDVEDFSEHSPGVERRFRETYLIHPDGTHPHVHGANIGIRADIYLRAGGWNALESAEDHDLWGRLASPDYRRFSVAALKVITSGRRVSRAPDGFAQALAAHNEAVA